MPDDDFWDDDLDDLAEPGDEGETGAGAPRREPEPPRGAGGRPSATEGVRIVGAEEARAAYEEGRVAARRSAGDPRPGDRPQPPPVPPRTPSARFPSDSGGTPAARGSLLGEVGPREVEDRPTGSMELPHWTEPPSGDLPSLRGRGGEGEATSGRPYLRDTDSDWADDDLMGDLGAPEDDEPTLGALSLEPEDDELAFAREVEERREMVRRARAAGLPAPPTSARTGTPQGTPPPPIGPPPGLRGRATPAVEDDEELPAPEPETAAPPPPVAGRRGEGLLEPGVETPPLAPKAADRDLPTAIIMGLAIAVGALVVFNWGRGPAAWLVAVIATFAGAEVYAAVRARGYRPATPVGLAGIAGLVLAGYDRFYEAYPLVIGLVAITAFLWYLIQPEEARPIVNLGLTFLPFLYVGTMASFAGLMLAHPDGTGLVLGVAIAAVAHDVVGYFVGSRMGTRRFAPGISPNKTVEGLLGGMTAAVLASLIFVRPIAPWDGGSALWLGVVVAVAAPLGDLVESMIKRDIGIKDFSGLIPGHGGVMDRFDAILFSLPPAFYLVRVLELGA